MKVFRTLAVLSVVGAFITFFSFSSCGKKDDATPAAATDPTVTSDPTTDASIQAIQNAPVGSLSLSCGGATCIGTEGK